MERAIRRCAHRKHFADRQHGASIVEAVIALPILLVVILGAVQFALVYEAKATLNHASLQAARLGAVRNASPDAIRRGLARGLAALHSPDPTLAAFARTRMRIEDDLASDARIRILNPTREAFDDFGVDAEGEREIPNARLHARSTEVGAQSGINIQDANLLKVQITYGYELQVPLVNWFIARLLLGVSGAPDSFEQQLLRRTRIPIMATATVRMQSPARLSDAVASRSEFPQLDRIPRNAPPPPVGDDADEEDQEPLDDDSPSSGNDDDGDDNDHGLDDGFFGFGGGDPGGGSDGGGNGNEGEDGGGSGGGLNGGNPAQCPVEEGGGSPFPFPSDDGIPGESSPGPSIPEPWFDTSAANGSAASIEAMSLGSLAVGNPIHVATGNKFQTEVDIDSLPGMLGIGFRRHYNSAAVNDRSVLGAGWRHSYQATLRKRDGVVEIIQADGRLLMFTQAVDSRPTEEDFRGGASSPLPRERSREARPLLRIHAHAAFGHPAQQVRGRRDSVASIRLVAQRASDGTVLSVGDGFLWRWPSGRELSFNTAGHLTQIRHGNYTLTLHYNDASELTVVSDSQHRTLRFEYYSNGRLAKVRGPGHIAVAFSYDSVGNLAQVTGTDGNARRYTYEDDRHPNHLTGISVGSLRPLEYGARKEFERIASWGYDEQGRAIYSSHPQDAGKVTLAFEQSHTDVTDAFGRTTRYMIERRHGVAYVSEVLGPDCGTCRSGDVRYEYNDRFQPVVVTAKHAPALHYQYDDKDRLIKIERASSAGREWLVRYVYDDATSRVTRIERPSVKSGDVAAIEFKYSAHGQIERMREIGYAPDGGTYRQLSRESAFTYDSRWRLRLIDGPRSDVNDRTEIEYDDLDRVVAIKTPAGEKRVLAHDASSRPIRIAETGRPDLALVYDSRGRITSVTQLRTHGTIAVSYSYDHAGRLVQIVDGRGRQIRYGFDAAGRPNRMSRSDADITVAAHYAPDDSIERIAAFTADGQVLRTLYYAYDFERRLTEVRDGEGQPLQQLGYLDEDALPDRTTDPLGGQTSFEYDALGRLAQILAPDGGATRMERDRFGRATKLIAPNDAKTAYDYDDFGRRVRELSADRGETKYAYDAADNLIEKTDARGAITRLTYDAANRLIGVVRPDGTSKLRYTNGWLTAVDGEIENERYEYDWDGQLIRHRRTIDGRTFTTRLTYDSKGRVESRELPSGTRFRYGYASNGALQSITQERWRGNRVLAQTSGPAHGNPTTLSASGSLSFGNGIDTRTTFDAQSGNLTRRAIERVATLTYAHDDGGRITAIDRNGSARRYEYDAVGRLTRASTSKGDVAYSYDSNGNRVSASDSALSIDRVAYEYAPSTNRLLSVGDNTKYEYDEAGNPLTIGARRYEYDSSGRLTKLHEAGRIVAEYRYNFWGERVQKIVYSSGKRRITSYIYEQQKLIAEADERGNITREYVYLDQQPITVFEHGRAYWIHTDHLGTPIAVTDEDRRIVWQGDYRPFGEAVIDADPDGDGNLFALNLRFPGQYADEESGTSYNYFRDYDPRTGRYLTADPVGVAGGMNSFAYVSGDPVNSMDSLGLYDQMVHYYMTYFLGLVSGLPQDVARTMAIASQYVDENYLTEPIHGIASPNDRALPLYHFVMDYNRPAYGDNNENRYLRFQSPESTQLRNLFASTDASRLRELWVATHPSAIPGTCPLPSLDDIKNARYQLFGEYLHAFEDTFAHRDAYNMSYAIGSNPENSPVAWLGHAGPDVPDSFGLAPDNTYNQNFHSPSRCTIGGGNGSAVIIGLSRSECAARGGGSYVPANDDDTTECEVRYVLGGNSVTRNVTEAECAALGRSPGALASTFRPGSGDIWAFNELRTLRMEYEIFSSIQSNFGAEIAGNRSETAPVFSWADVAGLPDWDRSNPWNNSRIGTEQAFEEWAEAHAHIRSEPGPVYGSSVVLQQFNSSRLGETERLAILNAWLLDQGITGHDGAPVQIEEWSTVEGSAGNRRNDNVGWLPARSVNGALLPTDSECQGRGCP